jgi:transposase
VAYGRLSMRKTKEVLRLKFDAGLSNRQIARAIGISCSTVSETVGRVKAAGLTWPLPEELSESALERRLYRAKGQIVADTREPDWQHVHAELARKHVTLMLLWSEYKCSHPEGYQYSWFCERYRSWAGRIDVVMRQVHVAGEKLFVDWAGDTLKVVDAESGELRPAYLFVAVLGASNYTYAEATGSEDSEAFLAAHVRAFEFFGGVPQILVPDNLKTGVAKADRYEPDVNPAYADLAAHYGACVIPARAGRPRDKAKVETGVLVAYRWIYAVLRNRIFFSLASLNAAIAEQLTRLNERPFKKLAGSRASVFAELDSPALSPLPAEPYLYRRRKRARVHIDYHVELEGHYYSVPYHLAREQVELVFSESTVEVFHDGGRVAVHLRSRARGRATTEAAHMPAAHREVASWTPARITAWAAHTGPATAALAEAIMASRPHPELGFRSCLGILRLAERYGPERLEAASERALAYGARSYKSVKSMLEAGLDREPLAELPRAPARLHENVRGAGYYT